MDFISLENYVSEHSKSMQSQELYEDPSFLHPMGVTKHYDIQNTMAEMVVLILSQNGYSVLNLFW